jgi:hypothetical protein
MATPAGFHRCVTAIMDASGRDLSERELEAVFEHVQGRARRYRAQGFGEQDALIRAGTDIGTEMRMRNAQEKNSMLRNLRIRGERLGEMAPGREAKDLMQRVSGGEGSKVGVADSTDAKIHGLYAQILGPFVDDLYRAGLQKVLRRGDKAFDRAIIRELWNIRDPNAPRGNNPLARQAAEIIDKHQEVARLLQNAEGAFIGRLEHYVARQSHDMDRIRGAGFETWRDFITPRLSERTFDVLPEMTPKAIDDYLRGVYRALSDGVHEKANGGDVLGAGFTGPGNLAKRISEGRKLEFRDADAWADYNEQFGKGTLFSAVRSGLESAARNTGVMRDWGTNPEAMFETVRKRAIDRAHNRDDFDQVKALQSSFTARVFDQVTGKAQIPENQTIAAVNSWIASANTLTKLGGVVLTSIPDLATNAALLRHNGVPLFESYFNSLRSLIPSSANEKHVMYQLGVAIDGVLGNVAARFTAADGARGVPSRLVDLFHRVNGLEYWTESLKGGLGVMLSHNLGRQAGRGFDQLPARLQVTLRRYGIEAAEWDGLRAHAAKADDGRMHIMPGDIADTKLRTRYQTYVADQVREGMTEPDAWSRTVATGGTQAGTIPGITARLLMQFKQYPITFMRRTLNREVSRDGADIPGIAHIIVATTALGYVALEAKALASGRNPRASDATREDSHAAYARLLFDAMKQGGGAGFYGDFLFGQPGRGSGPVVDFLGPTVGWGDQAFSELQNLMRGTVGGDPRALRDAGSGGIRLLRDSLPGTNLFYTRAVLDHFVWHSMQEWANPGYISRYVDRVRREQGQTFRDWTLMGHSMLPQNAPRW